MRYAVLALPLGLLACSSQPDGEAGAGANAGSPVVSITLPVETAALPATRAGELITNACTACHSVEMIRQQPRLDATQWAATVKKMREAYHAEIAPDQDAALVAALIELQGK